MFFKGTMRDQGIDVTLKGNPDHVLAPDDQNMVRKAKLRKITPDEFKNYYKQLLRKRWDTRKGEFLELIERGRTKDIKLKCHCSQKEKHCHAFIAAEALNAIISKSIKNDK